MIHQSVLTVLTQSGGVGVLRLLLALSVLALAVIMERGYRIGREYRYQLNTLPTLWEKLERAPAREWLTLLRPDSILARVAGALESHAAEGPQALERLLETRLLLEKRALENNVIILGTLGNNAPFVGLLGTVLGVIRAFHDLAASAGQGPEVVMQGISEALVATAVGIIVALPCVVFYNGFQKQIKDTLVDANRFGQHVIGAIASPPRAAVGR